LRLDFNVLWVDDQPARVAAQITGIAKVMVDEGFHFNPQICKTIDDVRNRISDNVFKDEIDLILVDWDLGGGVYGQDAIAAIREMVPYKDVVFYSARNPADGLRKLAFEAGIEGVYCASREDLVEEVLGVFESLVKKVLDLDHARGIIMGATSDIDNLVMECLFSMYEKLNEAGRQSMIKEALARLDEKIKDMNKRSEKVRDAASITAVLKAHWIFTANDRLRMLSGLLEIEVFKAHAKSRPSVIEYLEKVVPRRNQFGHLVLTPKGKPQSVATIEGKEIGIEEVREIRRLILSLRAHFKNLRDAVRV
jgi:hypothetical protein